MEKQKTEVQSNRRPRKHAKWNLQMQFQFLQRSTGSRSLMGERRMTKIRLTLREAIEVNPVN